MNPSAARLLMASRSAGGKALALRASWAVLLAMLAIGFLTAAALSHAQGSGGLTWVKLLDRKPHVIAFSPGFATDRLVLLGNSNKDIEHGIWRSIDGGETWVKSSEGIPENKDVDVYEIVFSPAFAQDRTVFASINKQRIALREAPGAIFRSTDRGQTWHELQMSGFPLRGTRSMQDLVSFSLSPAFANDGVVFAVASATGVFRSTDRGVNWQQVLEENASEVAVAPSYAREHMVAVATANSGMLVSTDGGATWSPAHAGLEGMRNFKRVIFSADFARDRTMLAMNTGDGIFISRDAAGSWQNIARPPFGEQIIGMSATPSFVSDGFLAYAVKSGEVFLTEDLGRTWKATGAPALLGGQIETVVLAPDYVASRTLYAVSVYQGLFRYYPVVAGSEEASKATAVAVAKAATAEALPTVMAREEARKAEELVETGCIAYYIPPVMLIGVLLFRGRKREQSPSRAGCGRKQP